MYIYIYIHRDACIYIYIYVYTRSAAPAPASRPASAAAAAASDRCILRNNNNIIGVEWSGVGKTWPVAGATAVGPHGPPLLLLRGSAK